MSEKNANILAFLGIEVRGYASNWFSGQEALSRPSLSIGVATYQMFRELPKELKNELPSPEQIALLLEHIAMK